MKLKFRIINIVSNDNAGTTVEIECDESWVISDLFPYFASAIEVADNPGISTTWKFEVDEKQREVVYDFNLKKFIEANDLDINNIVVRHAFCGRGATAMLDEKIKLQIRPQEGKHINNPHVHIYVGDVSVSISLDKDNFKITQEEDWKKIKRKDRKDIIQMIKENQGKFRNFYNEPLEKGLYPEPVLFKFRGKEIHLNSNNKINISD